MSLKFSLMISFMFITKVQRKWIILSAYYNSDWQQIRYDFHNPVSYKKMNFGYSTICRQDKTEHYIVNIYFPRIFSIFHDYNCKMVSSMSYDISDRYLKRACFRWYWNNQIPKHKEEVWVKYRWVHNGKKNLSSKF